MKTRVVIFITAEPDRKTRIRLFLAALAPTVISYAYAGNPDDTEVVAQNRDSGAECRRDVVVIKKLFKLSCMTAEKDGVSVLFRTQKQSTNYYSR